MPSHWNAQLVRLMLFVGSPVDGSGLWQSVVGQEPEVDEHRPREGTRRQAGQLGDATFELGLTGNRLDWIMTVVTDRPVPEPIFHIGEVAQAVRTFDERIEPWLATRSDLAVLRIAFGLIAVLPVPDRIASYARPSESPCVVDGSSRS
jgi:hypothetical protein